MSDIVGKTFTKNGKILPDLNLHHYKERIYMGVPMPAEYLDELREMEFRPGDILMQGYSKSGTTRLQHLIWLVLNGSTAQHTDKRTVWSRVPLLDVHTLGAIPNGRDAVKDMPAPRFFKTHLPAWFFEKQILGTDGCKCIVITRNPKDALTSYYHFMPMIFPDHWFGWSTMFDLYKEKYLPYGDWADNVTSWGKHVGNPKFLFVTYEQMKKDPRKVIRQVAEFLKVPCSDEQVETLNEMISFDVMKKDPITNLKGSNQLVESEGTEFIRKGIIGDWKSLFTEEQSDYVDKIVKERVLPLGIHVEYE